MSTVEQQVKAIVAEQLGVKLEQVTSDASFVDDLGADSLDTDIEEYAVKLDWNINEAHRANIRYSKLTQDVAKLPPSSWNNAISLSSHWYNQNKTFESTVAQLFSDWSDNFSTELKVSRREYDAIAQPTMHTT